MADFRGSQATLTMGTHRLLVGERFQPGDTLWLMTLSPGMVVLTDRLGAGNPLLPSPLTVHTRGRLASLPAWLQPQARWLAHSPLLTLSTCFKGPAHPTTVVAVMRLGLVSAALVPHLVRGPGQPPAAVSSQVPPWPTPPWRA